MFVIRRHPHFYNDGGFRPDPCGMMLLSHLHRSLQAGHQEQERVSESGKTSKVDPKNQSENSIEKGTFQSRTYSQRVLVKKNRTNEGVTIAIDVPGFTAENLEIKVEGHVVSVFGKRKNRVGDTFVVHQCFPLGDKSLFDEDTINASLKDEVLEITIHEKPKPKARLIPIALVDTPNALAEDAKKDDNAGIASKKEQEIVVESVSEKEDEDEDEVSKSESVIKDHNPGTASKTDQEIVMESVSEKEDEDDKVGKSESVIEDQHSKHSSSQDEDHAWEQVTNSD